MKFRYESDVLGSTVLGFHDGLDSWTLVLEEGQGTDSQRLVAIHERAHHYLHRSTPWGLAMLLAGLAGSRDSSSNTAWRWLGDHCRLTHERYATWKTVTIAPDGLDSLRGNLAYLDHVRWVEGLLAHFPGMDEKQRDAVVEQVFRYAMSPAGLVDLDFVGITRLPDSLGASGATQTPDARLDRLEQLLTLEPERAETFVSALDDVPVGEQTWDAVRHTLDGPGVDSSPAHTINIWAEKVVAEYNATLGSTVTRGRVILEDSNVHSDSITMLLDIVQRERLRLHSEPLPLRTLGPDHERPPISEFVRESEHVGPYSVLAWVLPSFLRKHFSGVPAYDESPRLGLLSVDRRPPQPHALWSDLMPAPPALIYAKMKKAPITTLLFMTLRSLVDSAETVDFRGWSNTNILIDSDVLAFLQHGVDMGEKFVWWVFGLSGSRTLDTLVIQRESSPTETYFVLVSSTPRQIIEQWMRERPDSFMNDRSAFDQTKHGIFALVDLLVGTLWRVDVHN